MSMTPQYRIEEYLAAIRAAWLGETPLPSYPAEPAWRIEKFLAAILSAVKGDSPVLACPEPVWHIEEFARAIYDALTGASPAWACPAPTNNIEAVLFAIYKMVIDGSETDGLVASWDIEQWLLDTYNAVKDSGALPLAYKRVLGFSCNNNAMWEITDFYLKGSDTVRISFSVEAACNVFGCYQGADADDNYDLYVSTTSGSKYLRYGNGTYLSYWSAANLGNRFDVVFSPTGTSGMPDDSTWTENSFTAANDLLIGSTTLTGTSSKLKGNLYGNIVVDERLNLIPCERVSDGVLGYYDTVGHTFYEPYSGFDGAVSLGYA